MKLLFVALTLLGLSALAVTVLLLTNGTMPPKAPPVISSLPQPGSAPLSLDPGAVEQPSPRQLSVDGGMATGLSARQQRMFRLRNAPGVAAGPSPPEKPLFPKKRL